MKRAALLYTCLVAGASSISIARRILVKPSSTARPATTVIAADAVKEEDAAPSVEVKAAAGPSEVAAVQFDAVRPSLRGFLEAWLRVATSERSTALRGWRADGLAVAHEASGVAAEVFVDVDALRVGVRAESGGPEVAALSRALFGELAYLSSSADAAVAGRQCSPPSAVDAALAALGPTKPTLTGFVASRLPAKADTAPAKEG